MTGSNARYDAAGDCTPEEAIEAVRLARSSEAIPPLPTNQEDWEATVRLYRIPDYLRAKADYIERLSNGELPTPDPRSFKDMLADHRNPTPEKLRRRVDHLRAESARLSALADEIERRIENG